MKNFKIPRKYLCDVPYTRTVYLESYDQSVLASGTYVMQGHKDHPGFTRFRNYLEKLGYIKIEKSWINGDEVLKPFKLNGLVAKVGWKFPCAAALGTTFRCKDLYGNYTEL